MAVLCGGCTAKYYRTSADKEVYRIIENKTEAVEGMPAEFTIESPPRPTFAQKGTTLTLTLQEALGMAALHSREYQSRKEQLYIQALSLTLARWDFAPIFSVVMEGEWAYEGERDNPLYVPPVLDDEGNVVEKAKGSPTTTIHTATGTFNLGVRKALLTGGDVSVQMVTRLFRITSLPDPSPSATSVITAAITQPLLRGFGPRVALEPLTQAERDMIYAMRDFVRFRRTFLVRVAKDYFAILRTRNELMNTRNNYLNLVALRERAQFLSEAGQMPEFQVDQAKQDELRAYANLIRAQERYENSLDEFKITLGIPTDVTLVLDYGDMERLASQPVETPQISEEQAIAVALARRLDLRTTINRVDDADRRLYVARNALLPRLDVSAQYQIENVDSRRPLKFESYENDRTTLGASLELPLDRKSERNAYRRAIIEFQAARRNLDERIDRIKQDVRNALRALQQAEQSYQIQRNSLLLAERRVESLALLQEAGQASTRDVLEAREALLEAQNAVTGALVDHYNARLDLNLAMETLDIAEEGFVLALPRPAVQDQVTDAAAARREKRGEGS
ncbi:MAG: TolC family protein [Candidatus Sumerlaeia bacterium]